MHQVGGGAQEAYEVGELDQLGAGAEDDGDATGGQGLHEVTPGADGLLTAHDLAVPRLHPWGVFGCRMVANRLKRA
ncbi:hypothetical protein GCM10010324_14350 [Streptomyces hiroshimensis]|uniref:Uncharacterized protein n=1 Tax=Streptomyces hiroshimensis TaxID=66424 RepID=A0ABQ2Y7F8_9ACTN|nr:hypothetical protein GCM10010324_14350 [Streptomyces hiroshimensis]